VTRAAPRAWLAAAFGFGLGLLPSVLHGLWIGWPYYWQSIHDRRLMLYNEETVALAVQWNAMTSVVAATASSWAFLAVASVLAARTPRAQATRFGALWLAVSIAGVAMGGWWREHYFIQLVPPLVFLASQGLAQLAAVSLRFAWGCALAIALALFVHRDVALALQSPQALSWSLYHRPGYLLQDHIAAYLSAPTAPEEPIYVAFAEAELYYLAGRRAAVPKFYSLHAQYSQGVFDQITAAVDRRTPVVIVVAQPPPPNRMSDDAFHEILAKGYAPDRVFHISEAAPLIAFRRK